ncbi:Protein kinase domain [Dillenia turbinata]|uniref:Protein kinase domain n=1 Tax=Dillenia turbinata TaxID=194707 RepID=A0AAN8YUY5_9MAGN
MKNSEQVLFLLFCFLLHLLSSKKQSTAYAYTPSYNFAVDCGATGPQTGPDGRSWTGDNSKYAPTEQPINGQKSISATASHQANARVPYYTARVSTSPFSYSFPITSGQMFIRLYFYPADYSNFNRSSSFFNVTAGDFTLLSNFSASVTADYLNRDVFAKEFCLNIDQESQKLNMTFIPFPNSYAFVNGIEVVSMPTNLYYTGNNINYIGVDNTYQLLTIRALETMYRLNVGGRGIPAKDDTGMFRSWDSDDSFLAGKQGVLLVNLTIQLQYSKTRNYMAPDEVYVTARTMGTNATENMMYNLTWALEVDTGFTYLVRLHFCEFQPEIQKVNDREFKIYIANQTAEDQADVIVWSGGNGIPVSRDYAVTINYENPKTKTNLLIALHPGQYGTTRYADAILNGLELFKISYYDNSLAGSNPNPTFSPPDSFIPLGKKQPVFCSGYWSWLGWGNGSDCGGCCVHGLLHAKKEWEDAWCITVRAHVVGDQSRREQWEDARLEICIGAARGLEYLHGGATHMIIHRDVKSTNILLDSKWAARVADFGLSKFGPAMDPDNPISTIVKGTRGYLDPEYIKLGRLTTKCDVYSFGVVLLEAISGRRPVDHELDDDRVSLVRWAQDCKKRGALHQLIDPYLVDQIAQKCLRNFADLAISCLRENGIERPTMKEVVGKLEFVLQLQVEADAALQSIVMPSGPPSVVVSTVIAPADRGHLADNLGSGFTTVFVTNSTNGLTCISIDSGSTTSSDD